MATITGTPGDDRIRPASAGGNSPGVTGGAPSNADDLIVGTGGSDTINGGGGFDTLDYTVAAPGGAFTVVFGAGTSNACFSPPRCRWQSSRCWRTCWIVEQMHSRP